MHDGAHRGLRPAFGIADNAANPAAAASASLEQRKWASNSPYAKLSSPRRLRAMHDSRRVGAMAMALVTRTRAGAATRCTHRMRRGLAHHWDRPAFARPARASIASAASRHQSSRKRGPMNLHADRQAVGHAGRHDRGRQPEHRYRHHGRALAPHRRGSRRALDVEALLVDRDRRDGRQHQRHAIEKEPSIPAPVARARPAPSCTAARSRDGDLSSMKRTAVRMPSSPSFSISGSM